MKPPGPTGLWLALLLSMVPSAAVAGSQRPAILVVSPQGTSGGWVDLDYLRELHDAGFEVDYTAGMADVTWDRLAQYNVLVVYTCPPDPGQRIWPFRGNRQPIYKKEFIALIERFLAKGGGVLLMAVETQIGVTLGHDMIKPWGVDLPLERIVDPTNTAFMTRMPKVPLAYTDRVASSPVSAGIRGIWYPIQAHYNGADTIPLAVDEQWQVVVRAMPTAHTVPVDLSTSSRPGPPGALVRPGGVAAPPLFAIRQYGAGRIGFLAQWPIYSLGSGTKWLYNREVLSKGLGDKPSDLGRLLQNTFDWLADPSLRTRAVGGYVTKTEKLEPPNLQPSVLQQFSEPPWRGIPDGPPQPPRDRTLFRGIIGAQTAQSGGHGTVADYAMAARATGLDFVVFLEDFANIDAAKLAALKTDCARYSDAALTLYPGYRIDTNIGNHMFLFGPSVELPPARLLTGPNLKTFMLQGESPRGVFGPMPPVAMEFLFGLTPNTQIGYYDFAHSGMGMRLPDARLYAMIGLRTYRDGTLIEDLTNDYLTTVQATIAPAPAGVHLLTSPAALEAAAQGGQGLTYAMARSRQSLWQDALLYTNQYSCPNVFTSTGPLILSWPECVRVSTYGAEPFVTGRSLMDAPIYVTAEKGLKEVRLYDGQNLFRRFILSGEKIFSKRLFLEGSVQRNLVLLAEDAAGGTAVSFPRRSWKDGSLAPVFCSDRINDCGYMFLARGPYPMTVLRTPELPDAGFTWDGGPRGILTPVDFVGSNPRLDSSQGQADGAQYNQTPLLEFADEGAVTVRSVHDELIDERVRAVNPWRTYGPRAPARLMEFSLRYTQFDRPSTGPEPVGWAAPPSQLGCNAALFRGVVTFQEPLQAKSLRLLRNWSWIPGLDLHLVVGRGKRIVDDLEIPERKGRPVPVGATGARFRLGRGHWFGFYSHETANSQLFINRGRALELQLNPKQDGEWLSLWARTPTAAASGQEYRYELFSVGCPLDIAAHEAQAFADTFTHLNRPEKLRLIRGRRRGGVAPREFRATDGVVHFSLARPDTPTNLLLPVIVSGLNRRWSAGLWQVDGYVKGDYGPGTNRYRAVGLDLDGRAYVPLYPDLADRTEVEIGHPVIADARGRDLFIQVTALSGGTEVNPEYAWSVEVNNPTDETVTTVLTTKMNVPNLDFTSLPLTLQPGEDRVINFPSASRPG